MAKKKAFKAESKRLLEMMINSIYTHKEIFIRELISNASDAMDKLYFKSLNENLGLDRSDFEIRITPNTEAKTLTITDNGIGMTQEELENNLGVIAQSGSFKFKEDIKADEKPEDVSVIGQFGVGFYSAFMVAKRVTVRSKAYGADTAYMWSSEGVEGYTVEECEKDGCGTEITLYMKDNTDDEDYEEFLHDYKVRSLVKKYSDYIRYPIKMLSTHRHLKEDAPEDAPESEKYEEHTVDETLNSMIPIWKKSKTELKDEDYNRFYQEKFYDMMPPLSHIHSKTEGTATYSALLFIPQKAPFDYYSKEFEKGLQLYSNGVLIMDKCSDLLPDHFSFVKGLVDSEDLSLNISREMLQHDRQLKLIARSIERTVKNELKKLLSNDREKYEEFWKAFGLQIKFGIYNGYGMNKDLLQDLLMFTSSKDKKSVTLDEYVEGMKEGQEDIYYASGETAERIDALPIVEAVKDKGYEILYLTDNVDEFCLQMMVDYKDKKFKSVQSSDLDLETEEEKKEIKEKNEDSKDLCKAVKEALGDKVADVRLTNKLKTHPVCISSDGALSVEMEKVLNSMPTDRKAKADKALEINPNHPVFDKLQFLYDNDKEMLSVYANLLFTQAMLIEGMPIENPVEFSEQLSRVMAK
ncbi:MAG: molecular chaperone HtpG [Firmicutes bacterium]|nr:molecular chaperone HtpG [[Eubacterium] siraeum]MCM1488418.1 molecular chaperone HtpG [Bacillota bacterium]